MGSRLKEFIEKLVDKVRELTAPPVILVPVPVTPNRRPYR
ncbi:MAG: hypothetical protein JWN44_5233 [Myxococcales bacterium]|nr:hypothetical protein [Myxococcales bacterium]